MVEPLHEKVLHALNVVVDDAVQAHHERLLATVKDELPWNKLRAKAPM